MRLVWLELTIWLWYTPDPGRLARSRRRGHWHRGPPIGRLSGIVVGSVVLAAATLLHSLECICPLEKRVALCPLLRTALQENAALVGSFLGNRQLHHITPTRATSGTLCSIHTSASPHPHQLLAIDVTPRMTSFVSLVAASQRREEHDDVHGTSNTANPACHRGNNFDRSPCHTARVLVRESGSEEGIIEIDVWRAEV